jgi:hypothetical protein
MGEWDSPADSQVLGVATWLALASALLACIGVRLVLQWVDDSKTDGDGDDLAHSLAATTSSPRAVVAQRYRRAVDRIERLGMATRRFIPFADRAKFSERAREERQQGDGMTELYAPIDEATRRGSYVDLRELQLQAEQGQGPEGQGSECGKLGGAAGTGSPPPAARSTTMPRNAKSRTISQLQSIIGLTQPEAMAHLETVAEIRTVKQGGHVHVSTKGQCPRELWIVVSGGFTTSTFVDGHSATEVGAVPAGSGSSGAAGPGAAAVAVERGALSLATHAPGSLLSSSLQVIAAMCHCTAAISTQATATKDASQVLRLPLTERVVRAHAAASLTQRVHPLRSEGGGRGGGWRSADRPSRACMPCQ